MITEEDVKYMTLAMTLAERGKGWVNPNPLVGAVIVKEGRILSEGWHERYGDLHAERNAFKHCNEDSQGATMYVTLEPCCHFGKQPPCVDAIIEHGIRRVVVGLDDPNPLVSGKGYARLREAGIEVESGVLKDELREQNRVFLHYITSRRPWVVMKSAMTLDGKVAAHTGDSRWVTGEESRAMVHRLRSELMAIVVGANTVAADDPLLNCRLEGEVRQPIRVVVDSAARLSMEAQLVQTAHDEPTIVVHTSRADAQKLAQLRAAGVETLACESSNDGRVDIGSMLKGLADRSIDSLLLEGGGELNFAFLRDGFVNEVYAFVAPKYIGGRNSRTSVEGDGFDKMSEAVEISRMTVHKVGDDILIKGRIK